MKSTVKALIILIGCFFVTAVFAQLTPTGGAAAGGTTIAKLATNITSTFGDVGRLMIAVSYIAGIGFAIAALFKFKQHKDNPTQIPVGTPIALLVIGIALIFLPVLISPIGFTIFGQEAKTGAGGPLGTGFKQIPGAGGSGTGG